MLEKGTADGVSPSTLDAIARALYLTNDETAYLHNLIDPSIDETPADSVAPLALGALEAIVLIPAYICTPQWNVLRWNPVMSLVWGIEPPGGPPFNIVWRMFSDVRMRALHGDGFVDFARRLVAMVRVGAGRLVDDPVYGRLYAELRDDPVFAAAWDTYDVAAPFGSFRTRIVSPAVGEFVYEALSLQLPGDAGQSIVVQVPDEVSADRLHAALQKGDSGAAGVRRRSERQAKPK